jgi:hypothetical protein
MESVATRSSSHLDTWFNRGLAMASVASALQWKGERERERGRDWQGECADAEIRSLKGRFRLRVGVCRGLAVHEQAWGRQWI